MAKHSKKRRQLKSYKYRKSRQSMKSVKSKRFIKSKKYKRKSTRNKKKQSSQHGGAGKQTTLETIKRFSKKQNFTFKFQGNEYTATHSIKGKYNLSKMV